MYEFSDQLMSDIRNRFEHVDVCPHQGARVFFENAGGALTLKSVVEVSHEFAAVPDNQGRENRASRALVDTINLAKDDVRCFFNAQGGEVFTGESGTELLFRIISVAALGASDGTVLGSTLEHPASVSASTRWAGIAAKKYVQVKHNSQTGSVSAEDYAPLVTASTCVATIVHTSPVTGMAVDVAAIAKVIRAKAPDCIIVIDGIQHAAHGLLDVANYDVDAYVISPYKVFSRHGYGLAWISDRLAAMPHDTLLNGPANNWELGTRDTGSYATFSSVVNYFKWLGEQFTDEDNPRAKLEAAGRAIQIHEKSLTDAMLYGIDNLKGLSEMGNVTIIGGVENPLREGLVSFAIDGQSGVETVEQLNRQGIRTHVRKADHYSGNILTPLGLETCVRVSLCHYNTKQEVAQFLGAVQSITQGA